METPASRAWMYLPRSHASHLALLILYACFFAGCSPAPVEAPQARARAKFEPPAGKILLIVGQDFGVFETYTTATGIVPGGFMVYTSIQEVTGLDSPSHYEGVSQYAKPLAEHFPATVAQVGLYMVSALEAVNDGTYDPSIDKLGDWIQKIKRPVFLRIGYEFDGDHNHYDSEQYKKAFRYIVDRFRKRGVTNAAFVWHSTCAPTKKPLEAWYPGDKYVDWFAISYFDQPQAMMLPMVRLAKIHHKPLMIAESTPRGNNSTYFGKGSWDSWFTPYFKFIADNDIKAISYIDDNWDSIQMWKGKGWGDARIETNPYVKEHWLEEIRKPKYLHSSPDLFKKLGYSSK